MTREECIKKYIDGKDIYIPISKKCNGYFEVVYDFAILNFNQYTDRIIDYNDNLYYFWLKNCLYNQNSMIINKLRQYYKNDLENFVFHPLENVDKEEKIINLIKENEILTKKDCYTKIKEFFLNRNIGINQKWHLYISWFAYKEYSEKLEIEKNCRFRCIELKEYLRNSVNM